MTARTVPLKYLAKINERTLPENTDPDFELRYIDISAVGRGELLSKPEVVRFHSAPSRARRLVQPGDTIISTVRTYLRAVWPVDDDVDRVVVSTGFAVLTPRAVEGRYFSWWVRSDAFIEEVVARSVGVSYPAINPLQLGDLPVRVPPLAEQQATADFLDTETTRIDALITKKRLMLDLLDEWEQAQALSTLGDFRSERTKTLRQHGAGVLTGPFGTVLSASEYVEDGVPLINPTHICRGRIEPEPGVSVPQKVADRIGRHKLSTGDIVMARKGDVGRSAIVPQSAEGWICGSDSIAIRCNRENLHPGYVAAILQLDLYRQQLHRSSTGAMVANVNEGTLRSLRLPALTLSQQAEAVATTEAVVRRRDHLVDRLWRQISLLQEHRQALITAAVTGDLEVPGMAAA